MFVEFAVTATQPERHCSGGTEHHAAVFRRKVNLSMPHAPYGLTCRIRHEAIINGKWLPAAAAKLQPSRFELETLCDPKT
jgi:hypothetical protein